MVWLANDDPIRMQAFEQMPMIEYLLLLDKKVGELYKSSARSRG
jgi:hypothetical protein